MRDDIRPPQHVRPPWEAYPPLEAHPATQACFACDNRIVDGIALRTISRPRTCLTPRGKRARHHDQIATRVPIDPAIGAPR
jgi:hypothetical protein